MSVLNSDIVFYGSANMPSVDGSTAGGAVDFTKRVSFTSLPSASTVDYVSSSASDTAATLAVTGRDSTGVLKTETKTLTGVTPVAGSQSFERLLQAVAGGTGAVGDIAAISHTAVVTGTAQAGAAQSASAGATITLQSGQGASCAIGQVIRITNNLPVGVNNQLRYIVAISGDVVTVNRDWGTVPTSSTTYGVYNGFLLEILPNPVTSVLSVFQQESADAAGGSTRTFYTKLFVVNNNTTTAQTLASIIKQADPSGLYSGSGALDFALCSALNDTGTVTNRQTAPVSGITSFSSGAAPQTINVPSPQNLPSGVAPNAAGAQGVWLKLTLPAGIAAAKGSVTMRESGTTT